MIESFEKVILSLTGSKKSSRDFRIFDPTVQFHEEDTDEIAVAQSLNSAFLIALAWSGHPEQDRALNYLHEKLDSSEWSSVARFYLDGIHALRREIKTVSKNNPDFGDRLSSLSEWVSSSETLHETEETTEKIWSVFFPEAIGIREQIEERIEELRRNRTVTIQHLNPTPITNPIRQILFTSNILLTLPSSSMPVDLLHFSDNLKERIIKTIEEPQLHWYDHPIQMGVEPEKNEVLHGLRGLDSACEFERVRGLGNGSSRLVCLLSASVTHAGLKDIARAYLEEEFSRSGGLSNLDVYVFSEADTQRIVDEVLIPAAKHYMGEKKAGVLSHIFGVDGEYGRHYSFLKAIGAFWQCFINREIEATFKIDLDQVFPQRELVEQSGSSAFEHLMTPLWGARGLDSQGEPVEFGMIAGTLVNEGDVCDSLFCPDVTFPDRALSPDEYIFFSVLPQALSTEAEMMTRYKTSILDGKKKCIQRIHVTGGTNGILIKSLRHHRPFTPSFVGRAEDQAYILSTFLNSGPRLAYVHEDGLIMRHDKEAFAQEAIQSAHVGKLVGDYVRILLFSAYAGMLTDHIHELKKRVDPFTGCFISAIPITVVHLRFSLKAGSMFSQGLLNRGVEFIRNGSKRITETLEFISGMNSAMKQQYENERSGWNLYYDTLAVVQDALNRGDSFARTLQERASNITNDCFVRFGLE